MKSNPEPPFPVCKLHSVVLRPNTPFQNRWRERLVRRRSPLFTLPTLVSFAFVSVFVGNAAAQANLPAYVPFATSVYGNNTRLRGSGIFNAGNSIGSGNQWSNVWSAGLSYPGLVTSNGSGGVVFSGTPSTSFRDAGFALTNPPVAFGPDTNALYASFLLKVAAQGTTTNMLAMLANNIYYEGFAAAGVLLDQNNQLRLCKSMAGTGATNITSPLSTPLAVGSTNLIVFRYKYVAGADNDEVALWLNPSPYFLGLSTEPTPDLTTPNGPDQTVVQSFMLGRHHSTSPTPSSGTTIVDEIRVATTWAGVTPPDGTVTPLTSPCVANVLVTADGVILRGTNGPANGGYVVLHSTDVTLPRNQWSVLASNNFNFAGYFDCTNPATPGAAQEFYQLLASPPLPGPMPPFITTQPTSQTVGAGRDVTFSMVAGGTTPLSYQWFFNTNTPVTDGTEADLLLTDVQTNDSGGYSVVVTNVAGSVTSVVAILTVTNVAPSITVQPQSQGAVVGQTVIFSVTAAGAAPLSYQWYFNADSPLADGANATLILNNVQTNDTGGYSVVVTNFAGSVTSLVAILTVTNAAPSIATQPQDQTVTVGSSATFTVVASGTAPLSYQWYFNTNTSLQDATNATLTLNNVSTNDASGYSVVVTNTLGSVTSVVATLTVNPVSTNLPNFDPIGFANYNSLVTGAGSNAPSVIVTTGDDLERYSDQNSNLIIYVSGTLQVSGMSTHVRNNKTIIGLGTNATLVGGGLYLYKFRNVIIRNLTIVGSTEDDIGIHYSTNIWIDHCTLVDASDGSIDITQTSDYITISWCKFYYTVNNGHDFVNLIASSDSDNGSQYHITFHHNWWSTNCVERMPSDRFGQVHCYNNYYNAPGNNYCIRTRIQAEVRIENNFFENVQNPWEQYITSSSDIQGKAFATNNNVAFLDTAYGVTWTGTTTNKDGTIRVMIPGTDTVFTPPYSYTLDPASEVPNLVTNWAGAGKITITP